LALIENNPFSEGASIDWTALGIVFQPAGAVQLLEEEDSADEEFWNQDFFQEDKGDNEYSTESSEESEADSDFEEPV
jgi:hypothetical protein